MTTSVEDALVQHLRPSSRVVVADGPGAPTYLLGALSRAARRVGGIELVLGWCLDVPDDFEPDAFTRVRTVMGGFGLRSAVRSGAVEYLPVRLSGVPALLAGRLHPDVLLAAVPAGHAATTWGTEVSWMASVVDLGVPVLAVANTALPATADEPPLPADEVTVLAEVDVPPTALARRPVDPDSAAIGASVAALVPAGAAVQVGPGTIGDATLAALTEPVRIRTGMVTDAVVDLDRRGLLLDVPSGAYVAGEPDLYAWAAGRGVTRRIERTHTPSAADGHPWVTVNAALHIDLTGAVNVETAGGHVSGMGGHPDFAMLGHTSPGGLSVIAVPTSRGGAPTLVEKVATTSTARGDVDVVVTERGTADLRGLGDAERAQVLRALWRVA
jgi:acyl-CoA hydrolase